MDPKQFRDAIAGQLLQCSSVLAQMQATLAQFDAPQVPTLPSGSNLTLALERGGVVQLESNGTYEGTATFKTSGTVLIGALGAKVIGSGGPAVYVPPGVHDIEAQAFEATAPGYSEAVIRLGDNGPTQTRLDQEPYAIVLTDVQVPTHRGKRAFEINAGAVRLVNCHSRDTWHASFDSQGICVINSSGGLSVLGGEYQAGSSCFMSGGDTVKMLGANGLPVTPAAILLDGVRLTRPLAWRTDGVNRRVKNLFEIKNAVGVMFQNGYMAGNWKAAQTGEPVMLTPTRGGMSVSTTIRATVIEHVPSFLVLVGRHQDDFTKLASSVALSHVRVRIDRSLGGTGTFFKVGAEPHSLRVTDSLFQSVGLPGDTFLEYYHGTVRTAEGGTAAGGDMRECEFNRVNAVCGKYGFRLDGEQGGGPAGEGMHCLGSSNITLNEFGGDTINSYQKRNFPGNAYISRVTFEQRYPWETA